MADKIERRLREAFERLVDEDREAVASFAEFLAGRRCREPEEVPPPKDVPRPANESVVGAMKRLSETYFMIDKSKVLHQASALMSEHMMQGRPAVEVIEELEIVFRRQYERHVDEREQGN